jgi:hypothetical protein
MKEAGYRNTGFVRATEVALSRGVMCWNGLIEGVRDKLWALFLLKACAGFLVKSHLI